MWQKREDEWAKERLARERLMKEVNQFFSLCAWIVVRVLSSGGRNHMGTYSTWQTGIVEASSTIIGGVGLGIGNKKNLIRNLPSQNVSGIIR